MRKLNWEFNFIDPIFEMDKLVEVGKQLGLEGDKLYAFVIEQQEKER